MLAARERLIGINVANFRHLKDDVKSKFSRELREASTKYLKKGLKDYREVFANIARGLGGKR